MEYLHNGFQLELSPGAFPLSTDSMALSGFVKLGKNARVLDLGSGCGTLGLLLCARYCDCRVTGVELDEQAHCMALKNAETNQICDRLDSICADLGSIPEWVKPGSFGCCVSNPPYFAGGPKSTKVPLARRDDQCSMDALMASAAWALKYGGDFFLVHRPERLAELISGGAKYQLEAKRLCLLRHKPGAPVSLVLVQLRKGGKPGLSWEEVCLHEADGSYSEYYRNLYHL
jgi:tRNA1(Val) A37 N6-methylase TrmN6